MHAVRKKILFVIGDLDRGGAENHLSQLLPLLKEKNQDPYVYTLTHKGVLSEELEAKGIPIKAPAYRKQTKKFPAIISRPLLAIITFITLWIHIKRINPDVIHFFLPHAYIIGGICSLFTRVPTRIMSRRSLSIYSIHRPFVRMVEKFLHKKMDILLGNSLSVVGQLKKECTDQKKIKLIYNGVDVNRFNEINKQGNIRKVLGISNDFIAVTIVANIIPYKGHQDLIYAISKIAKSNLPDFKVLCVGRDDGVGAGLQQLARKLDVTDKIMWLGERNDVPVILCASDIGLLCSHQEGFSNSILESMAAGLPMVVTDVGGNKEAVLDGVSGLIVPPRDPSRLSEALIKMLESREKREKMGIASRKIVEEKFTQALCVKKYIELYESV